MRRVAIVVLRLPRVRRVCVKEAGALFAANFSARARGYSSGAPPLQSGFRHKNALPSPSVGISARPDAFSFHEGFESFINSNVSSQGLEF